MSAALRVLSIGSLYPPHHFGGAELTWHSAVLALRRRGHVVRVLTSEHRHRTGPLGGEEDPDVRRELRWYWCDGAWPRIGFAERVAIERHNLRVLRRHVQQLRPDVVLWAEMGGMSLSLIEQVRRARIPALGLVLDEWMAYGPKVDAWMRAWRRYPRLAPAAERIVGVPTRLALADAATWAFNSEFLREKTVRAPELALHRTLVLHSPVESALFALRNPSPWRWRLAYVGRVVEEKGVAVLIEAMSQLPRATLTVTGPGSDTHISDLGRVASRFGVRDRVSFVAAVPRSHLPEVYAAADAVVFPVQWDEPWGKVPLEAMSIGRPVIATATGGAREYLRDEENALLFDPGDVQALTKAVQRLAADEGLRARLCMGGRATARQYSDEAYGAALVAALEGVMKGLSSSMAD